MIMGSVHQEDRAVVSIRASIMGVPKYVKQKRRANRRNKE